MRPGNCAGVALMSLLAVAAFHAQAARVSATVTDMSGAVVQDAVIYAMPADGRRPNGPAKAAFMDQVNKEFVPFVLPVQVGAEVRFPNKDNIRHHVYSFSPTRKFELKLYSGVPAKPVTFDKAGAVALGCNIHDQMAGYIYVVESPWFAKTGKDGIASIEGLPAGEYQIRAWHPFLRTEPAGQSLRADETAGASLSFKVDLAPPSAPLRK